MFNTLQFILVAALFAVAAASDAYNKPVYSAPAYKAPEYSAPAYTKEYEYVSCKNSIWKF